MYTSPGGATWIAGTNALATRLDAASTGGSGGQR